MKKDRFLNVLRWQLALSKRQIVLFTLVFFAVIAIPQMFGLLIERDADTSGEAAIIATLLLSTYMVVGTGVSVFSHLKTRQQRINDFMLPATTKEKFIARCMVIMVALPLAAIVGFLAGDLVQCLVTLVFGSNGVDSATSNAISWVRGIGWINNETVPYAITAVLSIIALQAFFLLLGSIFHKHPLVMSVLAFFVANMLAMTVVGLATKVCLELGDAGYVITVYDLWASVAVSLFCVAFIVFCYWFAYRKYTRLQVINNKWINK